MEGQPKVSVIGDVRWYVGIRIRHTVIVISKIKFIERLVSSIGTDDRNKSRKDEKQVIF